MIAKRGVEDVLNELAAILANWMNTKVWAKDVMDQMDGGHKP